MQVNILCLMPYSHSLHYNFLLQHRKIDKCSSSILLLFQFRSICDSTSGANLWETGSRDSYAGILSARRLPCLCKTKPRAGALFTGNLEFCLMETTSNVIFQRKAILIQGDPNITWCEIANIIKLYDISVSVWVLSGSQPAKEKDVG